jgi:glycosyltransferase involved in cell wall biosynthesis
MRIGLIIYGSLETISGGYLYDRKMVEYLQDQGDEVKLISLPWRNYLRHLSDNFSADLRRRLKDLQVDILLEDELNHPSLFLLNERLRLQVGYPLVAIVHHMRCSEQHPKCLLWLYRQVERRYLAGLDGIIYNSQITRDTVEDILMIRCSTLVAYPAGDHIKPEISQEEIIERAKREGPLHILFLGNVIPRKGLHTLIDALTLIPEHTFQLSIVGRLNVHPGYVRSVQKRIADLKLGQRIIFHGALDQNTLSSVLQNSQLLVMPSSYEGFGIAYLEGMGYGLPAIASRAGGAKEIITHGENGYLIEPGDVNELARIIRELHQDREMLSKMSLAARERFIRHPGWQQAGEKIRQYLFSLRRQWDGKTRSF